MFLRGVMCRPLFRLVFFGPQVSSLIVLGVLNTRFLSLLWCQTGSGTRSSTSWFLDLLQFGHTGFTSFDFGELVGTTLLLVNGTFIKLHILMFALP